MMPVARSILVGGLGHPHDALFAAALRSLGHAAQPLGRFDADALDRGRRFLPRGQCAPLVYTTGALLRAVANGGRIDASEAGRAPISIRAGDGTGSGAGKGPASPRLITLATCGPCRFAMFPSSYRRALAAQASLSGAGQPADSPGNHGTQPHPPPALEMISLDQSPRPLLEAFGKEALRHLIETCAVADALVERTHRLLPYVEDDALLDQRADRAALAIAARIAEGMAPIEALSAECDFDHGLAPRRETPIGRAVLIGEPWSLHVRGDGRLNLPRLLARAGFEVEVPPASTWLSYLLFCERRGPWGRRPSPSSGDGATVVEIESMLAAAVEEAGRAAGLGGFAMANMEAITALAGPYLSADVRGGYGHAEVGLAARARAERRAHLVVSVKSFGCIPSSGISDAIVPAVLGDDVLFLPLEVTGDGAAARESRLTLRIGTALQVADREVNAACAAAGIPRDSLDLAGLVEPLIGYPSDGPRPYASSLACAVSSVSLHAGT